MSSSQGPVGVTGYSFIQPNRYTASPTGGYTTTPMIRDASDWTRYRKESLVYNEYSSGTVYSDPAYLVRGNDFRVTYANGRFKCTSCTGAAFSSVVVPGALLS